MQVTIIQSGWALIAIVACALAAVSGFSSVNNNDPVFNTTVHSPASTVLENQTNATSTITTGNTTDIAQAFLTNHCMTCHQGGDSGSSLDLRQLLPNPASKSDDSIAQDELWQQVFQAIDDQYMPPADHPTRPSASEILELKKAFLAADSATGSRKQPAKIRRLNRSEYENTIRDLFRMQANPFDNAQRVVLNEQYFEPATGRMPEYVLAFSHYQWNHRKPSDFPGVPSLPNDPPVEHGFDTNVESISFSPLQLETYFEISSKLVRHPELRFASPIWNELFQRSSVHDSEAASAEKTLRRFMPRAFRRPVTDDEVDRWLALFQREYLKFELELDTEAAYERAMKAAVAGVLVSPSFLLRTDQSGNQLHDYSIASRLSYLLWGSMPDDDLFHSAKLGRLGDVKHLRKQIRRMLKDPRCKSLSSSFANQWLKTLQAISSRPDYDLYPFYYDHLTLSPPAVAMAIEQMLLFESVLIENRSILDFIQPKYAYLNRILMDWYGLDAEELIGFQPKIEDFEDFFRVPITDERRGGILSGATMISTSATDRTSPVYRGAWILEVIYNRPPPPPPADIPPLTSSDEATPINIRERLEIHRRNPNCASCHDKIDPIGFALEEFDPIGKLRDKYRDGTAIDSMGQLNGRSINGVIELKQEILNQHGTFAQAFTEHLLEYALGRSIGVQDDAAINAIVAKAVTDEYRIQTIIREVAVLAALRDAEVANPAKPNNSKSPKPTNHLGSKRLNRK